MNKVTPGGTVSTFATGLLGPEGLAFGLNGDLYIAQNGDGVEQVPPNGQPVDIANGPMFDDPSGIAVDIFGNIYVANSGNGTVVEVVPWGVITQFASGFKDPQGLAFGPNGNLYVANSGANAVNEVTPTGKISTVRLRGSAAGLPGRWASPLMPLATSMSLAEAEKEVAR